MKSIPIALLLVLTTNSICSAGTLNHLGFYGGPVCRGWYCYEPDAADAVEEAPAIDWEAVWTMKPDSLRTLINEALSFAQTDPTDETRMLDYIKLQGVAMRRAKSFQEAWGDVLLKYPILDATVQRAPTQAGTTAFVTAEKEDRATAIQDLKGQMGLIYFYSPSCRYCQEQLTILQSFAEKWSWANISAVNVDGRPDVVAEYGIQTVPDLWVAGNFQGETYQRRLRSGLTQHGDIERGLLNAWSLWTSGARYEQPQMATPLVPFEEFVRAGESRRQP